MALSHKLSHAQVIAKSEGELATIAKSLAEQEAKVKAIDAGTASINARWQQRTQEVATAKLTVDLRSQQYEQLRAEADVSAGTLDEGSVPAEQLRVAERELRKAQKTLADIEARVKTEDAADQAKLQELAVKRGQAEAELDQLQKRKVALTSVIETKTREIGLAEQRDVVTQLELLKSQVASRQSALTSAEEELAQFASSCLQRLDAWPDLQDEVKHSLPPFEDATTHVLENAVNLWESVITDGPAAVKLVDVPEVWQTASLYGHGLPRLLDVSEHEIHRAFAGASDRLRERVSMLRQVLQVYRQYRRR